MKYEVEVLKVGEFVPDMLENGDMVIFDDCPNDTLADVCYMQTRSEITAPIEVGDTVLVGTKSYRITAIGEEALHTLQELGHCTFKFDGLPEVELPGQISLDGEEMPDLLNIGDKICIK